MESQQILLKAAWIAPMHAPIIRDGAVVVANGRIVAVGGAHDIVVRYSAAEIQELGNVVLLPGLVNPHTHLEFSNCHAGTSPGGSFADWILSVRDRRGNQPVETCVQIGVEQCLQFGVTYVGDVTQQIAATRRILRDSPLRCVSYGEVLGLAKLKSRFAELLPQAISDEFAGERLRVGLSPHAPYTVDLGGYRQCVQLARHRRLPLATHLAETRDEQTFLQSHAGPFREIWERIGSWEGGVETSRGSPIAMAQAVGMLDYPTLLAHVNYCDDVELQMLTLGSASVVYCPRTHAYFGHPPHRWREMLSRGINVAVGTDSCASSPDLNLVDELRLLRRIAPEVPAHALWELATIRAAKALMWENEIGSLTPGKRADFVAFTSGGDDPLEHILRTKEQPLATWIGGVRCFRRDPA